MYLQTGVPIKKFKFNQILVVLSISAGFHPLKYGWYHVDQEKASGTLCLILYKYIMGDNMSVKRMLQVRYVLIHYVSQMSVK